MHGFQAGKHKAKVKNYANGGIVKGPGTGTSDDVPAVVPKDGYIMPADSTRALGFKPGMQMANLSNGEAVLTPEQVAQAGGFEALEAMKAATHTQVPEQATEQPKFFFANGGATDEERRRMLAQIPNSAPPGWNGGTGERVTGNDFTRNLSNTVNALGPVAGAAAPIVAGMARGFAGGARAAAASPVLEKSLSYGAPAAGFAALSGAANTARTAPVQPGMMEPQAAALPTRNAPAQPGSPAATGAQVDEPAVVGRGFTGRPNAQNMAAAEALAARSMPAQQMQAAEAPPVTPGVYIPKDTGGFGLLDKSRIELRNAMIDVNQGDLGSGRVVRALLDERLAQPGQELDQKKLQADISAANADRTMRADEQRAERGFRAGQLANDTARTALEGSKTAQEMEARGFDVGQARRIEALRAQYEAATDPKVRAELAQRLRVLSGKEDQANRFTVVPGGQEFDAAAGVMRNVPARVLNNQTGQFVDGSGGKAMPALKDNPAAMAVVNDPSMSKEERAAKLREMGYN